MMTAVGWNKYHPGSIFKKKEINNDNGVIFCGLRVWRKPARTPNVLPWPALFMATKIRRERRALICPVASCPAWLASSWVEGDASCAGVLASFASALPSAASCLLNVTGTENTASGFWLLATSRTERVTSGARRNENAKDQSVEREWKLQVEMFLFSGLLDHDSPTSVTTTATCSFSLSAE